MKSELYNQGDIYGYGKGESNPRNGSINDPAQKSEHKEIAVNGNSEYEGRHQQGKDQLIRTKFFHPSISKHLNSAFRIPNSSLFFIQLKG